MKSKEWSKEEFISGYTPNLVGEHLRLVREGFSGGWEARQEEIDYLEERVRYYKSEATLKNWDR